VIITKSLASDTRDEETTIEINTLEELLQAIQATGHEAILSPPGRGGRTTWCWIVYDDYVE
jgi:hypothetical protein